MSEADEMYEEIEEIIDDMIIEYKLKSIYINEFQREIDCLEELKRRLNE